MDNPCDCIECQSRSVTVTSYRQLTSLLLPGYFGASWPTKIALMQLTCQLIDVTRIYRRVHRTPDWITCSNILLFEPLSVMAVVTLDLGRGQHNWRAAAQVMIRSVAIDEDGGDRTTWLIWLAPSSGALRSIHKSRFVCVRFGINRRRVNERPRHHDSMMSHAVIHWRPVTWPAQPFAVTSRFEVNEQSRLARIKQAMEQ